MWRYWSSYCCRNDDPVIWANHGHLNKYFWVRSYFCWKILNLLFFQIEILNVNLFIFLVPLQLNWDKNSKNKSRKFRLFIWRGSYKLYAMRSQEEALQLIVILVMQMNHCVLLNIFFLLQNDQRYLITQHIQLFIRTYHLLYGYLSYLLFVIAKANWQCNWRVLFELFTLINKLSFSNHKKFVHFSTVRKLPKEMKFKLKRNYRGSDKNIPPNFTQKKSNWILRDNLYIFLRESDNEHWLSGRVFFYWTSFLFFVYLLWIDDTKRSNNNNTNTTVAYNNSNSSTCLFFH